MLRRLGIALTILVALAAVAALGVMHDIDETLGHMFDSGEP